jgi:Na+-transporting NADH:ubiquinone oxidoreductase subunit NqrC
MQLGRAKNSFMAYKKTPGNKAADYKIVQHERELETSKEMVRMESVLKRNIKHEKLERKFQNSIRTGMIDENSSNKIL